MFFSTRITAAPVTEKYENMSMQSLVKAVRANEKKASAGANKSTSPNVKKADTTGTALKVLSSPNSVDSRREAQTSDQLVRKLFKGLGVPMYDPRVPAMFIKDTVPPAVKDYRWTAYDMTVNHDTMLSIVPPPPPPTPPPLPAPKPQQIMESVSIKDIEEKLTENQPVENDKAQEKVKTMKNSATSKVESSAPLEVIESTAIAVKSPPQNAKKRRLDVPMEETPSNTSTEEAIEGHRSKPHAVNYESNAREQRLSGRASAPQNPTMAPTLEAEEKPEVSHTPQLSARVHEEEALMRAADSAITTEQAMQPTNSARGASFARNVDYSAQVRSPPSQKITAPLIQEEREMLSADSDTVLEKKFSGLAVQQMSVKSPPQASSSSRGKNYTFEGGDMRENDALSIESMLDLNSPESQWSFLKETAPTAANANGDGNPATINGASSSEAKAVVSRTPVHSPPAFIPPVPISSPSPTSKQAAQRDLKRNMDTEYHEFQRELQNKEHHQGKIISPAERSVFKPTFAAPRPAQQDAIASLLVSDGVGEKHFSLHASSEETPNISTVGNAKAKRSGYSALEEAFLSESPPPRVQYVQPQQYGKDSGDDDDFAHMNDREEQAQAEHKFSRHRKQDGAAHKDKHHSPSHWYMAGAYSSHSEAVDAINRLNKVLAQAPHHHGEDGNEGNHFRLQRDLSRMQWVVECNDLHNKAAVLSYTSKSGSHEKDKAKYRNIVGSIHKEEQALINPNYHSPPQQGGPQHQQGKSKQKGQGQKQLSPEAHLQAQYDKLVKKDDKYLRDRDLYVEQNLRAIRSQLPKDDSPSRAEGGTKFPPINQKKGKGHK